MITTPGDHQSRRRHPTGRRLAPPAPPPRYWGLLALVFALTLFGLVMVASASSVEAFNEDRTAWFYFRKQALLALVGLVGMLAISRIDYHRWRRLVIVGLTVAVGLCWACFLPGVGKTVNGATSWLDLGGPIQGQPSELMKVALLLYAADLLARRADRMNEPGATLWPVLIVSALTGFVVIAQKDLGTTIVIAAIVIAVLFVAGAPLLPLIGSGLVATAFAGALVWTSPYRRNRIFAFLDPSGESLDGAYQLNQALIGMGSGGAFGDGFGQSRQKFGFLPEAHTDFIFAVVGEELGFIGCALVLLGFAAFAVLGVRTAMRAPDRFGSLLAGGVTAWVVVQSTINLGAAVGMLPITGLPLPFISFGPSSLMCLMMGSGLLLAVARRSGAGGPGDNLDARARRTAAPVRLLTRQ